jgi:AGZA family xanthine/uracil permease-like MFS transporter
MTAQAFQEVPKRHALAVAFGLIPALAAWALFLVDTTLQVAGTSLFAAAPNFHDRLHIYGIIALSQGFLLSSMILASILVFIIERRFWLASAWSLAASVLSMLGLIHAYTLSKTAVEPRFGIAAAPAFGAAYAATAGVMALLGWMTRDQTLAQRPQRDGGHRAVDSVDYDD